MKKKQELLHVVSDVKSSELSAITEETKMMAKKERTTDNERS
ncbi:MAG: hypothetical protein ACI4VQ_00715 [Clostridia bacterium]